MATINSIDTSKPIEVSNGGTGAATLTDNGPLLGSGTGAITALGAGTADYVLTSNGAGVDPSWKASGSSGVSSLSGDTGGPLSGALTIAGGTNVTSAAAGSTVTLNLDAAISAMTSIDFATAGRVGTATSAGNTLLLQAYDVDGTAYVTFATLTANNTPTMDLDDAVTKAGQYIYRAAGTDVPVTDGGTGASTLTDGGILVGSGTGAITATAVGATGEVLIGNSAADPTWLTAGTDTYLFTAKGAGVLPAWEALTTVESLAGDSGGALTGAMTLAGGTNITTVGSGTTITTNLDATITLTTVNATTFDTNVAAAGVTIAGTTLAADGTDTDIDITLDPKGTGDIVIQSGNLRLPTTGANAGQIVIDTNPVLHTAGTGTNIFVGALSGNFTITGTTEFNTAVGRQSLNAIISGGSYNTCIGYATGRIISDGSQNCALGSSALYKLTSGDYNVALGDGAGYNYTSSESSNLIVGNNNGTVGESNVMRIGKSGTGNFQQDTCYIGGIYNAAVGATAGVVLSGSDDLIGGLAGAVGELFVGGTKPSFLTAGTANHVLTADGAGNAVAWEYAHALPTTLEAQIGTTYTLVLGDAGKLVTLTNASAITMTVPPNSSVAFAIGTEIKLYNGGAGLVTATQGAGVTINAAGSKVKLTAIYSVATLIKIATDTWVLHGDTTVA